MTTRVLKHRLDLLWWIVNSIYRLLTRACLERRRGATIAYFSPLPPVKSGVSDYSVGLLRYLVRHIEVDAIVPRHNIPRRLCTFGPYPDLLLPFARAFRKYDTYVYQIGNSNYHDYMYGHLSLYPGVLMLHDGFNASIPRSKLLELVAGSRILVHSQHTYNEVVKEPTIDPLAVHVVNHPMAVNESLVREPIAELRRAIGLPEDYFIMGAFGLATPPKRVFEALLAFDLAFDDQDTVCFLVIGHEIVDRRIGRFLSEKSAYRTPKRFFASTRASLDLFDRYIRTTDLCVNLRNPYHGETSGALLHIMSVGVPCIISNIGSFTEFPDNCVVKTDPEISVDDLAKLFVRLRANPVHLSQIGRNALAYVRSEHDPDSIASRYLKVIRDLDSRAVRSV